MFSLVASGQILVSTRILVERHRWCFFARNWLQAAWSWSFFFAFSLPSNSSLWSLIGFALLLGASLAGFPYEVLESTHYVPGNDRSDASRYKQKALWGEIMQVNDAVCTVYSVRVHNDFNRKVGKDSSRKTKAGESLWQHFPLPHCHEFAQWIAVIFISDSFYFIFFFFWPICCQKTHQLSLEEHQDLMDVVCLWSWLRPKIQSALEVNNIKHLDSLFDDGILGRKCGVLGVELNVVKSMFFGFFWCFGPRASKTRHISPWLTQFKLWLVSGDSRHKSQGKHCGRQGFFFHTHLKPWLVSWIGTELWWVSPNTRHNYSNFPQFPSWLVLQGLYFAKRI